MFNTRKSAPLEILELTHQNELLYEALRKILIINGIINTDVHPNGPELLLATEDYLRYREEELNASPECIND